MPEENIYECAREGCTETFTKNKHNQKFHNDECCRLATNSRLISRYHENKDRRAGKVRYCNTCNVTKLSRYNESNRCGACDKKQEEAKNSSLNDLLLSVSWQA